jgi:hypothetical protein
MTFFAGLFQQLAWRVPASAQLDQALVVLHHHHQAALPPQPLRAVSTEMVLWEVISTVVMSVP